MRAGLRTEKCRAQLAHRREFFAENHRAISRVHVLSPTRTLLPFLEDADALTKPARHLVLRERERDDVRELMPQHRLPVLRIAGPRRRAVRRDHPAKAHAKIPRAARQPEGADRKIFLVWENLHDRFFTRQQPVFFRQRRVCAFQQRERIRTVNLRFTRIHPHLEMFALQHGEMRDGVAQRREIERHHVVGIRLLHLLGKLPSLVILSEPQEILRELDLRRDESRIPFQRLALKRRTLGETILLRKLAPDEMRHRGIRRPQLQRLAARGIRALRVRAEIREHGAQRVRLGMARIDLQHLGELLAGLGVIFRINSVIRDEHARTGVTWIQLQHLIDLLLRRLVVARRECPRKAEVRLCVSGKFLHRRREALRCEREVVLRQREFAVREIRAGKIRAQPFHRIEKQLRHALRIRTEQDRRLAQSHAIRRLAVGPLALTAEAVHLLLHLLRALRVAVCAEHFVAREPQPHRIRKTLECLADRLLRLAIFPRCHQRLRAQQRPVLDILLRLLRRTRDIRSIGIFPREQLLPHIVRFRSVGKQNIQRKKNRRSDCRQSTAHTGSGESLGRHRGDTMRGQAGDSRTRTHACAPISSRRPSSTA